MIAFKKHISSSLLFVLLFLVAANVYAQQQSSAKASLSANSIEIGQQISLTLELQTNAGATPIVWATLPDTLTNIEVIEVGKIDTVKHPNRITYIQKLTISSFEPGNVIIPSLFFVVNYNAQPDTLATTALSLQVSTVPVDTTKPFKEIKDIAEVEEPSMFSQVIEHIKSNKALYIALVLLIGIAVFVFLYFRKNKGLNAPASKLPPEKPHEKAQRLLKELHAAQLWQQDRIKEYYSTLSDIIRNYLEERYQVNAPEQTTDELLALAKTNRDVKKVRSELKRILRTADLVKFAKANPVPEEHTACMEAAQEVIKRTMQKEEVSHD